MREVDAKYNEPSHPESKIVVKDFLVSVSLALSRLSRIGLLYSKEPGQIRSHLITSSTVSFIQRICPAVSASIVRLPPHDETAGEENDRHSHYHDPDVVVPVMSTCERIGSLQRHEANIGPPVDAQGHEAAELGQRKPGCVDINSVVPVLVQLRLSVVLIDVIVSYEQEKWAQRPIERQAEQATNYVALGVDHVATLVEWVARSV